MIKAHKPFMTTAYNHNHVHPVLDSGSSLAGKYGQAVFRFRRESYHGVFRRGVNGEYPGVASTWPKQKEIYGCVCADVEGLLESP